MALARSTLPCRAPAHNRSCRRETIAQSTGKGFGSRRRKQQGGADDEKVEEADTAEQSEQQGPRVYSPELERAKQDTGRSNGESTFLLGMGGYFVSLLMGGLLLAGSGLLPEGYDEVLQSRLYPLYSPAIGVFVVLSGLYGLWKAFLTGR